MDLNKLWFTSDYTLHWAYKREMGEIFLVPNVPKSHTNSLKKSDALLLHEHERTLLKKKNTIRTFQLNFCFTSTYELYANQNK